MAGFIQKSKALLILHIFRGTILRVHDISTVAMQVQSSSAMLNYKDGRKKAKLPVDR
jgi:hypothetical protein